MRYPEVVFPEPYFSLYWFIYLPNDTPMLTIGDRVLECQSPYKKIRFINSKFSMLIDCTNNSPFRFRRSHHQPVHGPQLSLKIKITIFHCIGQQQKLNQFFSRPFAPQQYICTKQWMTNSVKVVRLVDHLRLSANEEASYRHIYVWFVIDVLFSLVLRIIDTTSTS